MKGGGVRKEDGKEKEKKRKTSGMLSVSPNYERLIMKV
jgi:hypothetical protein